MSTTAPATTERAPSAADYPRSFQAVHHPEQCGWLGVMDAAGCPKLSGHDDPHRNRDPYGWGLWTDYDVRTGEPVALSLTWGPHLRQPPPPRHRKEGPPL